MTGPVNPRPAAAMPEAASQETREELLRLLDRETAIARATDGRLAVLILELRRVDRLQALLRGPAPATTMALVLERLHKSLRANELQLHFQPQIEIASGRPLGAEALIRWKHAQAGDLAPQTLIGIAERSGIIASLTFWIFNSALRSLSEWRARGIAPRLAIN